MICQFCNKPNQTKSYCNDCVCYGSLMAAKLDLREASTNLWEQIIIIIEPKVMMVIDAILKLLRIMRIL